MIWLLFTCICILSLVEFFSLFCLSLQILPIYEIEFRFLFLIHRCHSIKWIQHFVAKARNRTQIGFDRTYWTYGRIQCRSHWMRNGTQTTDRSDWTWRQRTSSRRCCWSKRFRFHFFPAIQKFQLATEVNCVQYWS